MDPPTEPKRIDRVILACVQCRSRHVKCDSTQPVCGRCGREGKECTYQKSRRGGLDKAALARRRLRLQQEAERAQQQSDGSPCSDPAAINVIPAGSQGVFEVASHPPTASPVSIPVTGLQLPRQDSSLVFQISNDKLLELFFENFWPAFPVVLPLHFLQVRQYGNNHGMQALLPTLYWIGSIYAPHILSKPFYLTARSALESSPLAPSPFNVQALMLFALAEFHQDNRIEAQKRVEDAVTMALGLRMNERGFAKAYGEVNPVLEESWRRTYYILCVVDQHFAIIHNRPFYTLLTVPNGVDLPCDDEYFNSGNIPPVATWSDYENREFADVEIIFSSIVYLYSLVQVVANILRTFIETGSFGESMIEASDAKLAIWTSLLPVCKKDPLREDGQVDEVMFTAHMIAAVTISTMHRPCSSLPYMQGEMNTQSFMNPSPFAIPSKLGRNAHTARTLKALDLHTKLLAIPCAIERHNICTMCVTAQIAIVQASACVSLLDGHAETIGRDRIRLSIGYLNSMGSIWALGKKMANEVRSIARSNLTGAKTRSTVDTTMALSTGSAVEIEVPRDDLIWPVDPSATIDIYAGIVIPSDWSSPNFDYPSSTTSSLT